MSLVGAQTDLRCFVLTKRSIHPRCPHWLWPKPKRPRPRRVPVVVEDVASHVDAMLSTYTPRGGVQVQQKRARVKHEFAACPTACEIALFLVTHYNILCLFAHAVPPLCLLAIAGIFIAIAGIFIADG